MIKSSFTRVFIPIFFSFLSSSRAHNADNNIYQATFDHLLQSGELNLRCEDNIDAPILTANRPNDISTKDRFLLDGDWSYPPICTPQTIPGLNDKLCVYTDIAFSQGRGISMLSTPHVAEEVKLLLNSIAKQQDHNGFYPNQIPNSCYTAPAPSKGTALFADRPLQRGDIITSHHPLLLAYKESLLSPHERERLLQVAIQQLPPSSRKAYLALATMYHDPTIQAQDIASANSFEMTVAGVSHLAVIPEPSRMNHDCGPNAIFHVDSSSLTHTVRVARSIAKDEEITISYVDPFAPFATRQGYLRSSFGFECTCARCSRGESDDEALSQIASLQRGLAQWADPTSPVTVKQVEELIRLHRLAGLEGYMDPAYCVAALVFSAVGSQRGVKKYTELCIEAIELRLGSGAEDLPQWRMMLEDPRGHWSWMKRKR